MDQWFGRLAANQKAGYEIDVSAMEYEYFDSLLQTKELNPLMSLQPDDYLRDKGGYVL